MKQLFAMMLLSLFALACNNEKQEASITAGQSKLLDSTPGECPYLTKDNKGSAVVSWVRMINDSTTAFCYARNSDGNGFSTAVVIPKSGKIQPHGENLPKIIFKPSGEIIALWGERNPSPKNKYSGLVFYTQSFDEGKTWSDPKRLIQDTASIDQRYYDVALLPNGEVGIIWLDNRKTTDKEGSALYFASTNGNNGFEGGGHLISESCCQCCRTDLFIDKQGGIHALYRGIVQDSIRDMAHIVSTDGGKTFSSPERISQDNWVINGCPHTGPAMTENQDGIHFAWFTGGKNRGCHYTKSNDNGKTFAPSDSVSAAGSHPQIASLTNGELLIVWDESTSVGDKVTKRIGIQRRNAEGRSGGKKFITDEQSFATYPVIATLDNDNAIVAFSKRNGNRSFVEWQKVSLR